ncbi:hypothetical protein ZOSMA_34G01180 [Zostera marina]|uniref:Uncharacterized protein n=1 Tax=Zostera marina TaxID=29655 RepID=A0A0K9P749_ZOSMR|nr:hypothetical protein ZOSMA_34G01180 [Zostera marina]
MCLSSHMDGRKGSHGGGRGQDMTAKSPTIPPALAAFIPQRVPVPLQVDEGSASCQAPLPAPHLVQGPQMSGVRPRPNEYLFGLSSQFAEPDVEKPVLKKKQASRKMKKFEVSHTSPSPATVKSDSFNPSTIQCNQLGNVRKEKFDVENESALRDVNLNEIVREVVDQYVPRVVVEVASQESIIIFDVVANSVADKAIETIVPVKVQGDVPLVATSKGSVVGSVVFLDVVEEEVPEDVKSDEYEVVEDIVHDEEKGSTYEVVEEIVRKVQGEGRVCRRYNHCS